MQCTSGGFGLCFFLMPTFVYTNLLVIFECVGFVIVYTCMCMVCTANSMVFGASASVFPIKRFNKGSP